MKLIWPVLISLTLALAGCGHDDDGDSSSGSGGSTSNPAGGGSTVNLAALAGNYRGSARLTLSALGAADSQTSSITATVNRNGAISITFDDDAVATGRLRSDGTFHITDTLANAGLDGCSGNVTIAGRVSGSSLTASISSSGGSCSGIAASASGSLNATRN